MKRILTLIAATIVTLGAANAQELANFARQGQGQQLVSPEVQDGKVTFPSWSPPKSRTGRSPSA